MLVGRCCSQLSGHQNYKKLIKSQAPTGTYPDSCHGALDAAACAAFRKESRMKFVNATNLNRKSGVA